jgi:hypothetical protein
MLIKKALKGELPLIAAAKQLQDEIMSPSMPPAEDGDGALVGELRACGLFKKVILLVAGTAMQRYGAKLEQVQEVLTYLADLLIDAYTAESAVLRAQSAGGALHQAAAQIFVNDAVARVEVAAKDALAAMAEGDMLRTLTAALRRLLKATPVNTVALRRQLAAALAERRVYPF